MRCVETKDEIYANIRVLDSYLQNKREITYSFALNLIKRGTCFVAVKTVSGYCFYPSRFIGYAGNNRDRHLNNAYKDGKETNPAISRALNHKVAPNLLLEKEYRKFCEELGFIPNERGAFGVVRKYWEVEQI